MADTPKVREMDELIEASNATPEFKDAVRALARGENQERINFNWGAPPVEGYSTLLSKILEDCAREPIDSVEIHGASGCSNFSGKAILQPGDLPINSTGIAAGARNRKAGATASAIPTRFAPRTSSATSASGFFRCASPRSSPRGKYDDGGS